MGSFDRLSSLDQVGMHESARGTRPYTQDPIWFIGVQVLDVLRSSDCRCAWDCVWDFYPTKNHKVCREVGCDRISQEGAVRWEAGC
jgi:hypothetical protein